MSRIVDIAEKAGVSSKTVSRLLNGHPHISARARRKIEAAIRDLNYQPRSPASGVSSGVSRGVGILFGDPGAGYQVNLYRALLNACQKAGHVLSVEQFDESRSDWGAQITAFLDRSGIDRIILVPPLCDSFEIHTILAARKVRCVLISPSRPVSGAPAIAVDDRLAALEMTQHLLSLGHRRIGFLAGREGHVATLLRRQGFVEAYSVAGLEEPPAELIRPGDFSFKTALDKARSMLDTDNPPTAIFACNDEMAAAVLFVANHLGLSVPGDLSVAGFDDSAISRTVWPELTTVSQSYDLIARLAVEEVYRPAGSAGGVNSVRVAPHTLIVRGSSGPVRQKEGA